MPTCRQPPTEHTNNTVFSLFLVPNRATSNALGLPDQHLACGTRRLLAERSLATEPVGRDSGGGGGGGGRYEGRQASGERKTQASGSLVGDRSATRRSFHGVAGRHSTTGHRAVLT